MKSEKLKISVAQRILNLSNDKLLKKIAHLLDEENIIGYDAEGNPITDEAYIQDVNAALLEFKEQNFEAYTSEEVRQRILGQ